MRGEERVKEALCPICHSEIATVVMNGVQDYEYGAQGIYCWLRCSGCGLIRLNPRPSDEILKSAYPPHYHSYGQPRSRVLDGYIRWYYRRRAYKLASYLCGAGTVLDIGCADGTLLEMIGREGDFKLFGVEYSPSMAKIASRRGIHMWIGDIGRIELPASFFDMVIMDHVLEHVFDPVSVLQIVRGALNEGAVVIGEVPNIDSWDARFFGRDWGGGHVPRHIWHFSLDTLERVFKRAGFSAIKIRPIPRPGHISLSVQNFLRRHKREGIISGRAWYYPLLTATFLPIGYLEAFFGKAGMMEFEVRA